MCSRKPFKIKMEQRFVNVGVNYFERSISNNEGEKVLRSLQIITLKGGHSVITSKQRKGEISGKLIKLLNFYLSAALNWRN